MTSEISRDRPVASSHRAALVVLAMLAFAANSVLCRMALGRHLIDPAFFANIRIVSGAVFLAGLLLVRRRELRLPAPRLLSVVSLFAYMALFALAYQGLSTGTGALLMFGFVQLAMVGVALVMGETLSLPGWIGLGIAMAGLVYLVMPGVEAPDLFHSSLMAMAGVAWGIYSLLGKGSADPTASTAANFIYAVPLAIVFGIAESGSLAITVPGIWLAIASGMVASGLGYAIWYQALRSLTATSAATIQLSVPAIATVGGVVFMSEPLTARIIVASAVILGGIGLVLYKQSSKGE